MKKILTAACLALLLPAAAANPFAREQNNAFNDYTAVISGDRSAAGNLKERANKGDRWAAMQYGYLAHIGRLPGLNGRPDYTTAQRAYTLASKVLDDAGQVRNYAGNHIAAYNLGLMYYYGQGVPRSGAEALRWFLIAANKPASGSNSKAGFYPAAVYAARIYANGYGVPRDARESVKYWRMAAADNEPIAIYEFGRALYFGRGIERNEFQAQYQLNRAANQWNVDAMYMLAQIAMKETRFQKANPRKAAEWLLIAGMKRPQYNQLADQLMANMNPHQKQSVTSSAASWIRTHNRTPEEFDYKVPLNKEPPERRY